MERVHFEEEQMLPELKAFQDEGIFTQKEIKAIIRQRRQYESLLVRRVVRKSDYLRYIQYEMSLEKLRKARVTRLQLSIGKNSITEFCLVRRQFALFERALKRPKLAADVGLWTQYIKVAQKEGASTLVGRLNARALSLHPKNPSLYILAASHALEVQHSPTTARTMLQRGLRLNQDSMELWKAYVGMEIGFIVTTGKRWGVLGISGDKGKSRQKPIVDSPIGGDKDNLDVEAAVVTEEEEVDATEEARKAILSGSIVKSIIAAAFEAIPEPHLLGQLTDLVKAYPAPKELREAILKMLNAQLQSLDTSKMNSERRALVLKLLVAYHFGEMIPSVGALFDHQDHSPSLGSMPPKALLDAVTQSIETLHDALRRTPVDVQCAEVYSQFVLLFCQDADMDLSLKRYLIKGLHKSVQDVLVDRTGSDASSGTGVGKLMAGHVRALRLVGDTDEAVKVSCWYTEHVCEGQQVSAEGRAFVWLARLDLEEELQVGGSPAIYSDNGGAWGAARKCVGVSGEREAIEQVWLWGLKSVERSSVNEYELVEGLMEESKSMSRWAAGQNVVHATLLARYSESAIGRGVVDVAWVQKKLGRQWSVDETVWKEIFQMVKRADLHMDVVGAVYSSWYGSINGDGEERMVDAVLEYAEYLLDKGRQLEASGIVARDGFGRVMGSAVRTHMEKGWTRLLENANGRQ